MIPDPIRIGIVAGEESGDLLGAGLMQQLRQRWPNAIFEGVGGPRMQAQGCTSLYPMQRLSIIGIFEVLGSLLALLRIRRGLIKHFTTHRPDVFIGIDAPQFNIGLEEKLRSAGIPTMHYVSPTVWAWRHYRIHHIRRAVDHMLVLFPFEQEIYKEYGLPTTFVGHPLADALPENPDRDAARSKLSLPENKVVVGLLPGSRRGELKRHAKLFVRTAMWLHQRNRKIEFAVPLVSPETKRIFEDAIATQSAGSVPMRLIEGQSREVMEASDVLVIASGTATLEAALLKRPMVVTYKVNWLTYIIFRLVSRITLYSLPNNLAGKELLPEYMQSQATPENLGQATEHFLVHPEKMQEVRHELENIADSLRQNADVNAANAVVKFIESGHESTKGVSN
jgi:lipid-A-disaccharide synthase